MKWIHLSDLHLGKRLHEQSLLDDQAYILEEILRLTEAEAPDGALIAGDIYDRTVPSEEAVELFDRFLVALSNRVPAVFLISGNHDSCERLAFGGRLMDRHGVYVSPVYRGEVRPVTLRDEWGEIDVFLLPFVKPAQVRPFFPEQEITSYTDAVRAAISGMTRREGVRRVLVTHQFVAGSARCESEEIAVGGSDSVDAAVFDTFDYVALGHLHGAQSAGRETVRYCGSPLKYSFSEAQQEKSLTVVEMREAGAVTVRTRPLLPRRDLRELRGDYLTLTAREHYAGTAVDDYLHLTLTDEEDVPEALAKLRTIYPHILKLDYDNTRTRAAAPDMPADGRPQTPMEQFSALYERQNGQPMSAEQQAFLAEQIEEIWGTES